MNSMLKQRTEDNKLNPHIIIICLTGLAPKYGYNEFSLIMSNMETVVVKIVSLSQFKKLSY